MLRLAFEDDERASRPRPPRPSAELAVDRRLSTRPPATRPTDDDPRLDRACWGATRTAALVAARGRVRAGDLEVASRRRRRPDGLDAAATSAGAASLAIGRLARRWCSSPSWLGWSVGSATRRTHRRRRRVMAHRRRSARRAGRAPTRGGGSSTHGRARRRLLAGRSPLALALVGVLAPARAGRAAAGRRPQPRTDRVVHARPGAATGPRHASTSRPRTSSRT